MAYNIEQLFRTKDFETLYSEYQKVYGKDFFTHPEEAAALGMTPEQAARYAAQIFTYIGPAQQSGAYGAEGIREGQRTDQMSLASVGAQPQPQASSAPAGQATGGGTLRIRTPDGQVQTIVGNDPQQIDQILKAGGQVLDYQGQPMQMIQAYGGWLAVDPSGVPLPLNVVSGEGWLPYQQEMIGNYISAGWKPGMGSLPQDPPIPAQAAQMYGYSSDYPTYQPGQEPYGQMGQGTGQQSGQAEQPQQGAPPLLPSQTADAGYGQGPEGALPQGYFAEPFNEQFKFSPQDFQNDPAYQFVLQEGLKALDRSASSKGMLKSGDTMKAAETFGQGVASQFYGDAWNRAMQEYAQQRDVFRTNRSDIFGRYASLADVGLPATNATASYGQNYGANAGSLLTGAGNATAAAQVAGGNEWRSALGKIGNAALNYPPLAKIGA